MARARQACAWSVILVAVAAGLGSAPADGSPRPHRIVAVGDLHGDVTAWRAIARAAGVMDAAGHWSGGQTVLVQAGDVVDRGPDSLDILRDLMRLEREASRAHGRVVALVGNHEAMNMTGDLRYVSPGDFSAFVDAQSAARRERAYLANRAAIEAAYRRADPQITPDAIRAAWLAATPLGLVEHEGAWRPGGWIGRWVAGHPAVVMLDGVMFVHGGISADYACLPVFEINRRVRSALATRDTAPASIINDPAGPLWYRGLVQRDNDPTSAPSANPPCKRSGAGAISMAEERQQVLRAYGAGRMVVAHTPILSGISVLEDGRLVRVDTGISAAFGGKLTYLEIADGALAPHVVERPPAAAAGAR